MNKKLTAAQILKREYGSSKNTVTPTVLDRVLLSPNVAAELSEGTGHNGQPLFGVSVAVRLPDGKTVRAGKADEPIRSGVFRTRQHAEAHLAAMEKHLAEVPL